MVDVFSWNPRPWLFRGRLRRMIPIRAGRRVGNFGDLLGPQIVDGALRARGLRNAAPGARPRLLSVGSVLHFADDGDVVWGSGLNAKMLTDIRFRSLDVRAVRGPRTREYLAGMGIPVPEVYGDPALLLPILRSDLVPPAPQERAGVLIIPNLNDHSALAVDDPRVIAPTRPLQDILGRIRASELVVGSSLHGIVLAEALGIPARCVAATKEPSFKYEDYFSGTGRTDVEIAPDIETAIRQGGDPIGLSRWDSEPLVSAFPTDLFAARAAEVGDRGE